MERENLLKIYVKIRYFPCVWRWWRAIESEDSIKLIGNFPAVTLPTTMGREREEPKNQDILRMAWGEGESADVHDDLSLRRFIDNHLLGEEECNSTIKRWGESFKKFAIIEMLQVSRFSPEIWSNLLPLSRKVTATLWALNFTNFSLVFFSSNSIRHNFLLNFHLVVCFGAMLSMKMLGDDEMKLAKLIFIFFFLLFSEPSNS